MGGMPTATFDQDSFRGRDDDVALNSTTWNGGGGVNGDWSQGVDLNFRCRFLLQETAGVSENNFRETLYYRKNGGTWTAVTSSSNDCQGALSSQYADGDDTTQLLGGGTFISANSGGVEGDGGPAATNEPDYAGNDETEFEFTLTIPSADVNNGDTIELRLRNNGTEVATYTNEPTITVVKLEPERGVEALMVKTAAFSARGRM